jgi:hypothetical protein
VKDVSDYVAKSGNKFLVDREDTETGNDVVTVGETVMFVYKMKEHRGIVSDRARGRDDDVLEIDLIAF